VTPEKYFSPTLTPRAALAPLLFVIFVELLLTHLRDPYLLRAAIVSLPSGFSAAAADPRIIALFDRLAWSRYGGAVVPPLVFCGAWAFLALLILGVFGRLAGAGRLFAVAACAYPARLVGSVFSYILLEVRGIDAIRTVADAQPTVGLGFLASARSPVLGPSLDAINMFEAWFLVVSSVAVAKAEQAPMRQAIAAAAGAWLAILGFRIILLLLLAGMAA
jgi:hypothetical protein